MTQEDTSSNKCPHPCPLRNAKGECGEGLPICTSMGGRDIVFSAILPLEYNGGLLGEILAAFNRENLEITHVSYVTDTLRVAGKDEHLERAQEVATEVIKKYFLDSDSINEKHAKYIRSLERKAK